MSQILPAPDAPEGSVTHHTTWSVTDLPHNSAVLCRVNAPLVATAFALLRRNVPCHIIGRDLCASLVSQIKRFRASNLTELRSRVAAWRDREVTKFEAKRRYAKASEIADRATCLLLFIDKAQGGPGAVITLIEKLFSAGHGVALATVHRAKGLEWDDVFILDAPKYMPSKFATAPWQRVQENNLIYVAVTRAKLNLHYVNFDGLRG